jgi:hypothetical protein
MIEDNNIDEVKIHIDEIDTNDDNLIRTCCGRVSDKRLLAFVASISLSSIVTIFSCYQLTQGLECSQETTYISLIMFILGFWLKSPVQA